MPKRSSKLPTDANQRAKSVVDIATGSAPKKNAPKKNAAAVALGRLGGLKGGKARAAALSDTERSAIAKRAAAKRWGKKSASDKK